MAERRRRWFSGSDRQRRRTVSTPTLTTVSARRLLVLPPDTLAPARALVEGFQERDDAGHAVADAARGDRRRSRGRAPTAGARHWPGLRPGRGIERGATPLHRRSQPDRG